MTDQSGGDDRRNARECEQFRGQPSDQGAEYRFDRLNTSRESFDIFDRRSHIVEKCFSSKIALDARSLQLPFHGSDLNLARKLPWQWIHFKVHPHATQAIDRLGSLADEPITLIVPKA